MLRVCQQLASTVQNVEQSIYCQLHRLQIYHCVQLNALFCCFWRNVEASCHKHFVVFSRNQHRRLLPSMSQPARRWKWFTAGRIHNIWTVTALTAGNKARYRLRIAISAYPTCIRRPRQLGSRWSFAMPFGAEKLRMVWLPDGAKILMTCLFILTEFTNVTDTRTDTT